MLRIPLAGEDSLEIPARVVLVEERTEGVFVTVEKIIGGQP